MADLEDLLAQSKINASPLIISGAELMAMEFPEPLWAVENILPAGLAILAGPPKKGKSWFALELAMAVCSGGYFLDRKAQPGRVLYCALEDSPRRMKDRLKKQGWEVNSLANLEIIFGRQFHELFGGKDGLTVFTTTIESGGYVVIIIDTVSRAFPIKDWNDTAQVTAVLSPLQEAASASGKLLLCVDHHRKRNGFDPNPIEDVLGSTSKSGVADTVLGLYREPGKPGAKLAIVGRDVDELTLELRFDSIAGCWTEVSPQDTLTDQQKQTMHILRDIGGATLTELVEATGRNKGTLHHELGTLESKGLVYKSGVTWKVVES